MVAPNTTVVPNLLLAQVRQLCLDLRVGGHNVDEPDFCHADEGKECACYYEIAGEILRGLGELPAQEES